MSLLRVSGVSMQEQGKYVLENIHFNQRELQKVAIAGETGSGKSTLLKVIAGYVQPDAGDVYFDGVRVKGPAEKLVPGQAGIAYLSQQFELPKSLRVEQVLRYANTRTAQEADTLYEVCRISHLLQRRTDQLSGGERQRIALARLLTAAPRLLLLDEPYSNLDMGHKALLKAVIRDIGEQLDITCTLVSHDPLDTLSWADQILVMRNGQLLQQGAPEAIYTQPVDEYTATLFGHYNLIDPKQVPALARIAGGQQPGKQLLVRPENIQITSEKEESFSGTIQQVHYFGSYYELQVQLPEQTSITVKTNTNHYQIGDSIYMTVAPKDIWYI